MTPTPKFPQSNLHGLLPPELTKNPFVQITPQNKRMRIGSIGHTPNDEREGEGSFDTPKRKSHFGRRVEADSPPPTTKKNIYDEDEMEENLSIESESGYRFDTNFEELETLGRGHFGRVVRAKNRFDGIEYAVKISNKPSPKRRINLEEALSEVFALSALSASTETPYIVRYYQGWMENEQLFI